MEELKRIHIAFAEDHVMVRKSIISYLNISDEGIIIDIEADNGIQLLSKMEQATSLPDICILDINMPKMNGQTVLSKIRAQWPDMKFLVLTAFFDEYIILSMIASGAHGYLLKSDYPVDIINAIHNIYDTGYHYSNAASVHIFNMVKSNIIKAKPFTAYEEDLLRYSTTSLTYEDIAFKMAITPKSIEGYRNRLYSKLNITTRVELALFAFQSGLVPIEDPR